MRFVAIFAAWVILASWVAQQASAATFTYTGHRLLAYRKPQVKGIPGATHLTITATGVVPAIGQCVQETITGMTDGANSLAALMSQGWVYDQGVFDIFKVCSDAKTGKLSAYVEVGLVAQDVHGTVVASWFVTLPYTDTSPASGIADLDEFNPQNFPLPFYETDANYKIGRLTYSP